MDPRAILRAFILNELNIPSFRRSLPKFPTDPGAEKRVLSPSKKAEPERKGMLHHLKNFLKIDDIRAREKEKSKGLATKAHARMEQYKAMFRAAQVQGNKEKAAYAKKQYSFYWNEWRKHEDAMR